MTSGFCTIHSSSNTYLANFILCGKLDSGIVMDAGRQRKKGDKREAEDGFCLFGQTLLTNYK